MKCFPRSIRQFEKAVRILRPAVLLVLPMHFAIYLTVMTLLAPPAIAQSIGSFSDSGAFQLFLQGKQVDVEPPFTVISSGGTLESIGELEMDIWTTPAGAIQRSLIPGSDLEVLRQ